MLTESGLNREICKKSWTEAANTATLLDNYLVSANNQVNNFQKFSPEERIINNVPGIFGEVVMVTNWEKIKSKLSDRAKDSIWLGYAEN